MQKNAIRIAFVTMFSNFAILLGKIGVVVFAVWEVCWAGRGYVNTECN